MQFPAGLRSLDVSGQLLGTERLSSAPSGTDAASVDFAQTLEAETGSETQVVPAQTAGGDSVTSHPAADGTPMDGADPVILPMESQGQEALTMKATGPGSDSAPLPLAQPTGQEGPAPTVPSPDPAAGSEQLNSHGEIAPEMIRMELTRSETPAELGLPELPEGTMPMDGLEGALSGPQEGAMDGGNSGLSSQNAQVSMEGHELAEATSDGVLAGQDRMPEGQSMPDSPRQTTVPSGEQMDSYGSLNGQLESGPNPGTSQLSQSQPASGSGNAVAGMDADGALNGSDMTMESTSSGQVAQMATDSGSSNASQMDIYGPSMGPSMDDAPDGAHMDFKGSASALNATEGNDGAFQAPEPTSGGDDISLPAPNAQQDGRLTAPDPSATPPKPAQPESPAPTVDPNPGSAVERAAPADPQASDVFDAPTQVVEEGTTPIAGTRDGAAGEGIATRTLETTTAAARSAEPGRVDGPTGPAATDGNASPEAIERAERILKQVRLQLRPDLRQATLELRPASLGRIAVQIEVEDGQTAAVIRAERAETLSVLERHLPELRSMFHQSGIDVSDLDLGLDSRQQADANLGEPQNRQHGGSGNGAPVQETEQPLESALATQISDLGVDTYA